MEFKCATCEDKMIFGTVGYDGMVNKKGLPFCSHSCAAKYIICESCNKRINSGDLHLHMHTADLDFCESDCLDKWLLSNVRQRVVIE